MKELLPKLRLNRHMKRAVVWGPTQYGGLDLKHMETEQKANTVESLIGHGQAKTPTGTTFVIACETYQILMGVQQLFFLLDPEMCPHRPPVTMSKITYIWEMLRKINGYIDLSNIWTPEAPDTLCIMDMVLQARDRHRGTVKCISTETVHLVNACRLWLRALNIEDLMTDDGGIDKELFYGHHQCDTHLTFLHQERPPEWVCAIWRRTLHQVCVLQDSLLENLTYIPCEVKMITIVPSITLPPTLNTTLTLQALVRELPIPYQKVLGDIKYPTDEGEALAKAIMEGSATLFTDGTVDNGCGAQLAPYKRNTLES